MKRWFVTGVSSGLGRALAKAALERGDHVAGTVRNLMDAASFEALAPERASAFLLDVTDHRALADAIAHSEAGVGLDVLVNNAGYALICALEEAGADEIRRQFEVNVLAPIAAAQAALPSMRRRASGRIVNISSVSGLAPWAGSGVYTASKFALEGAMRTLSQEVQSFGVHVIMIEPGAMRTDYAARSLETAARTIAAYADTPGHDAQMILKSGAGQEAGDPAKMAQAILTAVDHPSPPLQLLLGADAVHYATREAARFQNEMGEWISLSLSTRFGDLPAH